MSIHLTAAYRVRPEHVEEAAAANREFVGAVREREPGTLEYRAFRRDDDDTEFPNLMAFVDAEAEAAHRETRHVRAYVERLYPLCVEQPAFARYAALEP